MRRLALLPLAALALCLLAQCKKATPTPATPVDPLSLLPVESQTGEDTFGCLINGKAYLTPTSHFYANGDWLTLTELGIGGTIHENGNLSSSRSTIVMRLGGQFTNLSSNKFPLTSYTGSYPIFSSNQNQFIVSANLDNTDFSGKSYRSGQVELTKFDAVARIASGRFSFTLYEVGRSDTLRVTNGRFDVKF